ncbi:MAG: single-stranded DNA-binding protein [Planctomycetes bacterium]|nr:single-stranded DNA-binding protein [Planctomycetota bacterium]
MSSFNQIILMGHISRAPELQYLPSQTAVVNFGIATNEVWKDQAGEKKETVCFIDCFMFGKRAEALSKYFKKGDPIHVVGTLQLDKWEKDGVKHYKHKIKVNSWLFVANKVREED